MNFGLVLPIQDKDADLHLLLSELRAEVQAAEAAGFDAVYLPEFHQSRGGAIVSPLLVCAWLAAETSRIKVGTMVLATPLHDPIRLAEDALMLDHATGGRVRLGLGPGLVQPDFPLFGSRFEDRGDVFDEALELISLALEGKPFDHSRRFYQRSGQVTPGPYGGRRPPILIGASWPVGLERAARHGDGWISDPERDINALAVLADEYRVRAAAHGKNPWITLFRDGWIADSDEQVQREWAPHALAVHRLYFHIGAYKRKYEPWVDAVRSREDLNWDLLAPGRFLAGTPETVRHTAAEWFRATGADSIAIRMRQPGGPGRARTLQAIEQFGDSVINTGMRTAESAT